MLLQTNRFYDFEDFRLDTVEKTLRRDGKSISMTPKVFETLQLLVKNSGRLIEKDEMMRVLWQDRFVEESNLTFNIKMLRKALGDDAANPRFVENVPKRGYRFIADVRETRDAAETKNGNSAASKFGEQITKQLAEKAISDDSRIEEKRSKPLPIASVFSSVAARPIFYLLIATFTGVFLLTGFFLLRNPTSIFERLGTNSAGKPGYLTVEKLSETGNTSAANISPDGKMLVYYTVEGGKNTVWLRQFTTGKSIPIFSTVEETFHSVGFSQDGEFVYLSHQPKGAEMRLSRISLLGGAPTEILRNFHGGYSFSPDDRQIAFIRLEEAGSTLITADTDGKNERRFFTVPRPRSIIDVAWSPDGKTIAFCAGNFHGGGKDFSISEFNPADGTEKSLSDFRWSYVETLMWLPDKSGLLIGGRENTDGTNQIWRLSLPDGRAEQITNDSGRLRLRGASADFSRIVASQTYMNSSIWVAPTDDLAAARPIIKAQFDLAWTPDGKIIFPAKDTIKTDIWQTNLDGSEKTQLTANDSLERYAAASPDKKYIAFVSNQGGRQNIWRMDANGGNPAQLTAGEGETNPAWTPDGKSILYNSTIDESLWIIPAEGGTPKQILAEKTMRPAISPDGTKIAYFGRKDNRRKLLIKSFPEGNLLGEFENILVFARAPKIIWTKDAKSLIYENIDSGFIGNLWQQSLDGGKPRQITNFNSEQIFDFDFSPDGKHLALVRGTWNHDAVLLKGFK